MRTITRGAVHIEQCDNCKGVFLDGGELDQIVAAEREHYATAPPYADQPAGPPPPYADQSAGSPPPSADQPAGSPPPYQPPPGTTPPPAAYPPAAHPAAYPPGAPHPAAYPPGHYDQGYYGRPRRRSFLEELFD